MKKLIFAAIVIVAFASCDGNKMTGNDVTVNTHDDSVRAGLIVTDTIYVGTGDTLHSKIK